MDTPAVERIQTLLSKGGNDKEIYGLYRFKEGENTDLALRFDLTVPLARYIATYNQKLSFPFKRYQIGHVWRGERPQSGRYRQFVQGDIDIIGRNYLATLYDAEILSILSKTLQSLNVGNFNIKINHTNIIIGLLHNLNLQDDEILLIRRIIDKKDKISQDQLIIELQKYLSHQKIDFILNLISQSWSCEKLQSLTDNSLVLSGISELSQILKIAEEFGLNQDNIIIAPYLTRGLDYYTGIIFEAEFIEHQIGSIAAGGRYDNLVNNFTAESFPGIGLSIGISRIFSIIQSTTKSYKSTDVLVTTQDHKILHHYINIVTLLRNNNIKSEIYMNHDNLNQQLKYADKNNIPIVIIANADEILQSKLIVKNMLSGTQYITALDNLIVFIQEMLN
jgi:histidyl-tRNA synthetase